MADISDTLDSMKQIFSQMPEKRQQLRELMEQKKQQRADAPYGYEYQNNRLVVKDDEAAVVRWIAGRHKEYQDNPPQALVDYAEELGMEQISGALIERRIAEEVYQSCWAYAVLIQSNPDLKLVDILNGTIPEAQVEQAVEESKDSPSIGWNMQNWDRIVRRVVQSKYPNIYRGELSLSPSSRYFRAGKQEYHMASDLAIISPEEFAEAKRAFATEMFGADLDEDEGEER